MTTLGKPALALIWAMAENRVIGRDGELPWRLPGEMQYFRAVTLGKPVIVGRKTFESFLKPLPGRTNIVVSRTASFEHVRVRMARDLDEAIAIGEEIARRDEVDEIMLAGGAELYALALPRADRLYMTLVHAELEGDTLFPDFDEAHFEERRRVHVPADADNAHAFSLIMLERRREG
ncbi:MAG: dihydrofolate reductase [Pseudomonadales bacterium]|jgi:dihydrofolate reductase|nr:dihydrofolate reductase [Pseudomonadales bacterium]